MSHYPIPEAVLARHIACVGETGSGKTYDTKSIVEHLVAQGHRVCILDTIKSDWWGMISSASGKKAGLPFRIIGGPRGHVPLHAGAGKALGELAAKGKLPLSIIDMADFGPGDPQRFFEAFAQAIWKNIKGVLYLVIEEAHELAPKERAGFGKENMSVYWAKRLATGSRTKGIRLIVATQRVQALHNAVLGSCGTLAAHSLSFPADQKPVIDWLNNNIKDKAIRGLINDEMASLPAGHAWVACPKEGFIEKVHFPAIKTFDNTATPDKDAADIHVATAAVDPDELRAIIGDAVKEAEDNDPSLLKRRLVTVEAELAKLRKLPTPVTAATAKQDDAPFLRKAKIANAAYRKALEAAMKIIVNIIASDFFKAGGEAVDKKAVEDALRAATDRALKTVEERLEVRGREATRLREQAEKISASIKALLEDDTVTVDLTVKPQAAFRIDQGSQSARPAAVPRARLPSVPPSDSPMGAERKPLGALAAVYPAGMTEAQWAVSAGLKRSGGTWSTYVSRLRTGGRLEKRGDLFFVTEQGMAELGDGIPVMPAPGEQLVEFWAGKISGVGPMLRALAEIYPMMTSRENLAANLDMAPSGGTFSTYISRLRTPGLIEVTRDGLRASDALMVGA